MQKYILPIVIIALVIFGIILGYLISQQPSAEDLGENEENLVSSSDEGNVFKFPGPSATREQQRAHFDLARSLATRTDVLDISMCDVTAPTPIVFKLVEGETFTVRNNDDVEHTMVVNEDHAYVVSAKGTLEVLVDFGNGSGLYGYACDKESIVAGLLFIEARENAQPQS